MVTGTPGSPQSVSQFGPENIAAAFIWHYI